MVRSPLVGYVLTAVVLICAMATIRYHVDTLRHGTFTSGYFLLIAVLFLTAFHWRKRLSFIPLGTAAFWMQLHMLTGIIAMAFFAAHVGLRFPNGVFESSLFVVFAATSLSGLYGLYLSRTLPAKLSKLREEVLYERIPFFRAQVGSQAHGVVVDLVSQVPADTVADFYVAQLTEYFVKPRGLGYHLHPTSRLRNRLRGELNSLRRYCSEEELAAHDRLGRLIDQRDDLDYHAAQQGALKIWLFGHIGLTYGLLVLVVMHVILVHAFRGSVL